jgi:hypothetical protein
MVSDAAEGGALSEAIVFLYYFKDLSDPRQQGKVQYPLNEVLLLCLLAILAGAETIADIARFGEKKLSSTSYILQRGLSQRTAQKIEFAAMSWRASSRGTTVFPRRYLH